MEQEYCFFLCEVLFHHNEAQKYLQLSFGKKEVKKSIGIQMSLYKDVCILNLVRDARTGRTSFLYWKVWAVSCYSGIFHLSFSAFGVKLQEPLTFPA